jgi:hypothetical protein
MRKGISLETQLKCAEFYYENNLTNEQRKQYERFEEWFQWCSAEASKEYFNFEDNFAKLIENEHNLENFTTEQLIAELQKRTDIMFVGNFYDEGRIWGLCGANQMEAKAFMEDCKPWESDTVIENADIELQALFENWQDENDQIIND